MVGVGASVEDAGVSDGFRAEGDGVSVEGVGVSDRVSVWGVAVKPVFWCYRRSVE